ncbi:hypothetical protein PM082_021630 [Marasmius tenuissimus]|nr:hypothetical protein PM082_021630 [Marasmius tenuissimus]
MNERPFSNTVNGNMNSFLPSTTIHNNQCQHVYGDSKSYHGCTVYEGTPAPVAREARDNASGSSDQAPPHPAELRCTLPIRPLWVRFISPLVRNIARAAAMFIREHVSRQTIAHALLSTLDGRLNDSLQPRFPLTPSYWSRLLICSFIRLVARAAGMPIEERVPRDSINLNAQATDLQDQIGMYPNLDDDDRFPSSSVSVPSWTPQAEENI